MKRLIAAIEYLTTLPLGKPEIHEPERTLPYFPVVGVILGALVSMLDYAASHLWTEAVVAVMDVTFLVVMTGAFHLDCLGDLADRLLGHGNRLQVQERTNEHRIGAMGLVAVVLALSVKWAGIMGLDAHRGLLLIVVPAYARGAMAIGMQFLIDDATDDVRAHPFFDQPLGIEALVGFLIPVGLSYFLGWKGVWLNLFFILIVVTIIYCTKKLMIKNTLGLLGAMAEVIESALFLLMAARGL